MYIIPEHITEQVELIKDYYKKNPNGNIIFLKNRRGGLTLMLQLLQTEDAEMEIITNVDSVHELNRFKDWIKRTSLFAAIVQHSGTDVAIEAITEQERLSLTVGNKKITEVEDLPKELLLKFYENYPYRNKITNFQNLIDNGKKSE